MHFHHRRDGLSDRHHRGDHQGRGRLRVGAKGNQESLRAAAEATFDRLRNSDREPFHTCQSVTGGHDQVEKRRCWAPEVTGANLADLDDWHGLRTICMVEYERFEHERFEEESKEGVEEDTDGEDAVPTDGGQTTTERRYYISSLSPDAEVLLRATRRHWHLENRMHRVLDVAFQEDQSLSIGVKNNRLRSGWDHEYLRTILQQA